MLLGVGASDDFLAKKTVAGNLSASQGGYPRGRTGFLLSSSWAVPGAACSPYKHRDSSWVPTGISWCLGALQPGLWHSGEGHASVHGAGGDKAPAGMEVLGGSSLATEIWHPPGSSEGAAGSAPRCRQVLA